ncbi:tyrosine-type recombinase/integrase [Bradyrhizobium sp. USDA 4529]
MKRNFTDKFIRSLRAAPTRKRIEHWDTRVPCFGVRVTDKGHKTYVLYLRWPGSRAPSRREIGNADRLSLAAARKRAREWLEQVELGVDPRERDRAEEIKRQRDRQTTFAVVAEAWMTTIGQQRKANEVRADVRREFVVPWRSRPVTEITTQDVAKIIIGKRDEGRDEETGMGGHPAQARNLLGYVKRLFDWAVAQHSYGIEKSPAEPLSTKKLIGKKSIRQHVLLDDELRRVWVAATQIGYPYGPMIHMLILTGQRRSVVSEARWSEFDLTTNKRLWRIPKDRMKMEDDFVVPLAGDVLALLRRLPRFENGDHLFSADLGKSSVNGHSKAKERFDEITGPFEKPWVFHDLRRTMRTGLSALPIADNVRELMIAHAQGLKRVYDQYKYIEEKRQGFALWEEHLRGILQHQDNVVALHG